jgi:oligopeptide/dipeptide ABC transporter ATP-binding protein
MSEALEVKNLFKTFPVGKKGFFSKPAGYVHAVDGVSLTIKNGETLGIVGESGCGKSTLGRVMTHLLPATDGQVLLNGVDVTRAKGEELQKLRRTIQMIFQDPYSSLNPRHTVGRIVGMPLVVQNINPAQGRKKRVQELLELVGLNPEHYNRYPHEFSGGQRQRIGIARSLALEPKIIIADEPVSALDVSIQAQILNLLQDLQKQLDLSYVFIAHDLSVVKHVSDRVAVMYLGKIVEEAGSEELYSKPMHPYTLALLSAVPEPNPEKVRQRILLTGDVPSPINPPSGCRFRTRCWRATELCATTEPPLVQISTNHKVACHFSGPTPLPN